MEKINTDYKRRTWIIQTQPFKRRKPDRNSFNLTVKWGEIKVKKSLHTGQVAYQAKAYAGFSNTKRLGVFLLPPPPPPGWDAYPSKGYLQHLCKFAGIPSHTLGSNQDHSIWERAH